VKTRQQTQTQTNMLRNKTEEFVSGNKYLSTVSTLKTEPLYEKCLSSKIIYRTFFNLPPVNPNPNTYNNNNIHPKELVGGGGGETQNNNPKEFEKPSQVIIDKEVEKLELFGLKFIFDGVRLKTTG